MGKKLQQVRDTFENSLKLMGFLGVVYSISHVLFLVMAANAFLGAFATVTLFGGPLVQLDRNIRSQEVDRWSGRDFQYRL